MSTTIITLTNQQVKALQTWIVAIYRDAFVLAPYNKPEAEIAEFAQALPDQLHREGSQFVGAFENHSERIVGFAYGYTSTAGQWWRENVKAALRKPTAEA
jgi:hypothetical protein